MCVLPVTGTLCCFSALGRLCQGAFVQHGEELPQLLPGRWQRANWAEPSALPQEWLAQGYPCTAIMPFPCAGHT